MRSKQENNTLRTRTRGKRHRKAAHPKLMRGSAVSHLLTVSRWAHRCSLYGHRCETALSCTFYASMLSHLDFGANCNVIRGTNSLSRKTRL